MFVGCESAATPSVAPSPPAIVQSEPAQQQVAQVVDLMEARLALMHDVARWKWNAQRPIEDLPREAELLDRLAALADDRWQIPPVETRAFFQAQLDAGKRIQQANYAAWEEINPRPSFDDVPDLPTEQRPKLDEVSENLLAAWRQLRSRLPESSVQRVLQAKRHSLLASQDIADLALAEAIGPLLTQATNASTADD